MSDSTELATIDTGTMADMLPEEAKYDPSLLPSTSGGLLPYLRFYAGGSKLCKAGTFPVNHYGLHKTPGSLPDVDLGTSFLAFVIARRPCAAVLLGEANYRYYDPTSKEFQEAKAKAAEGGLNGYLCGMEWLVWVHDADCFATLHWASGVSMQNTEGMAWKGGVRGKNVRFSSRGAKNAQGEWFTPVVTPVDESYQISCSTVTWKEVVDKFINPSSKGPLLADTSTNTERAR